MGRYTYDNENTPKKRKPTKLTKAQLKAVRRKLLPQFIYIIAVFLPFCFILSLTYDIWDPFQSLSRIGWRKEVGGSSGWLFLMMSVVLTGPFVIYQVCFYLKNHTTRPYSKFLLVLVCCAAASMAAGAAVPFYHIHNGGVQILHDLHNGFAMLGALLGILTVTIILIRVLRESKQGIILIFYALFCFTVFQVYRVLENATGFEVGLVFLIFLFMYFINRTVLIRQQKNDG